MQLLVFYVKWGVAINASVGSLHIIRCTVYLPGSDDVTNVIGTIDLRIRIIPPVFAPSNDQPNADAGGLYNGNVGQPVSFDGSRSYDPEE